MLRTLAGVSLLTLGTLCASVSTASAETARRPNVLVILADDLGYGDLHCYGARDLQTPHIDRLISEGMRFDEFYANCPVCSPTRAALLTGRYPEMVGVPGVIRTHPENSWGYLCEQAVLLPQVLRQDGYHSAIIGKWHLGLAAPNRPIDRGFDHFHGFLGDMMDDYFDHRRHGINYLYEGDRQIDPSGHATDLFTDWACEYLQSRQDAESPFFLYLAYNAPHTPIQPPVEWRQKVQQREPDLDDRRAALVALVEHMDAGVGRVLGVLNEANLRENTLVVFTSDNGGQLDVGARNGPLRDGKQSVYEGGIKVCFGARWPGRIEPGARTTLRAQTMDLFPTICAAAGVSIPHAIDGVSFLPTLLGESQPPLRDLWFWSRREGGTAYGGKTIEAVRRGDWKLLQNSPFAPQELYNLAEDPLEQHDLARRNRQKFNELAAALRAQIQRYGTVRWQPPE